VGRGVSDRTVGRNPLRLASGDYRVRNTGTVLQEGARAQADRFYAEVRQTSKNAAAAKRSRNEGDMGASGGRICQSGQAAGEE